LPGVADNGIWLARALVGQGRLDHAQAVLHGVPADAAGRAELLDEIRRRGP